MCKVCKDVILRESFYSPNDYLACLTYISDLIDSGKYAIIEQTCPIDAVKKADGHWVNDYIKHKIKCINCGELFLVWTDTYHGRGGFTKEDERLKNAKQGSLIDLLD